MAKRRVCSKCKNEFPLTVKHFKKTFWLYKGKRELKNKKIYFYIAICWDCLRQNNIRYRKKYLAKDEVRLRNNKYEQKRAKRYSDTLHDTYIKATFTHNSDMKANQITKEMIETKRKSICLLRSIKQQT